MTISSTAGRALRNKTLKAPLFALALFSIMSLVPPSPAGAGTGDDGGAGRVRAVAAELEKAARAVSAEQELGALARSAALIRRCGPAGPGGENADLICRIRKLQFIALERKTGPGGGPRAEDYDELLLQVKLDLAAREMASIIGGGAPASSGDFVENFAAITFAAADTQTEVLKLSEPVAPSLKRSGPFVRHITEAIKVNRARAGYYEARTGGASGKVSRRLILLETASLPVALAIDRMAAKFNVNSVPVIEGDFVSMSEIPSQEAVPGYKNKASAAGVESVRRVLKDFGAAVRASIKSADFDAVCEAARRSLAALDGIERSELCHFALSKHIIESIGFAALNARRYASMSGGATVPLSKSFVRAQALMVPFCADIDSLAQECHALGAGIIVNDVPAIPFIKLYTGR